MMMHFFFFFENSPSPTFVYPREKEVRTRDDDDDDDENETGGRRIGVQESEGGVCTQIVVRILWRKRGELEDEE